MVNTSSSLNAPFTNAGKVGKIKTSGAGIGQSTSSTSSTTQTAQGANVGGQQNVKNGSGTIINTSTAGSTNSPVNNDVINVSGNKIKVVVKDINQASSMANILGGLTATATTLKANKVAQKAASTPVATSTATSTVL